MAKVRTRRAVRTIPAPPAPARPGADVEFVEIPQPKMLIFKTRESVEQLLADPSVAKNAYVKLAPTIRMSERATFDSRELREKLLAAGAVAVAVTPSVVADRHGSREQQEEPVSLTAEQHLQAWFETVKAPKAIVKAAIEEALTSVREAGL